MTSEQILSTRTVNDLISPVIAHEQPVSYLEQEYAAWKSIFMEQTVDTQHFLESQARKIAETLLQNASQVRFTLPESIIVIVENADERKEYCLRVLAKDREMKVGGLRNRFLHVDLSLTLRQRLGELETSPFLAVAVSSGLIRYAMAQVMVGALLPLGHAVAYAAEKDEEIPAIPIDESMPLSILDNRPGKVVSGEQRTSKDGGLESWVSYPLAARRFYLPQWVAFDGEDHLLVGSVEEAETYLASMQSYLKTLHLAVAMAPYIVADEEYQQKRYGILGQLINQGRALARFKIQKIIQALQRRYQERSLNRGLSLSLPYFSDQTMELCTYDFVVIPAGLVMFTPAFIAQAAINEQVKVAQNTRLSPPTRKHLLVELKTLEEAFIADE